MWPFTRDTKATARRRSLPVYLRGRFDAAQTTADNARHWAMADSLSADAAASAEVRKRLRDRSRYEVANNSYAKGIILTLANDCVGTGPRLQVLSGDDSINRRLEEAFSLWAHQVDLPELLRTMRMAKATDGESFALLTANPALNSPVHLDVRLIEADRVTSAGQAWSFSPTTEVDGIELDNFGNPARYHILPHHPGEMATDMAIRPFDSIPARSVLHWFRADRPHQHRGVPEITPALPLFAQLRRYTLAVIAAAETAADFAAVLYTDAPAQGEAQALEPMDVVELEKRMATVLPDGWRLGQIQAQQPTTAYGEFKHEILNEIARCLNLPYNIAAGNSSGYNYASGRLDHQTYFKSIRVEQAHMASSVLDRIFDAWVREAMLTTELSFLRRMIRIPHQWFFDGTEHVDPAKEARAQQIRLSSCTTSLAAEYARAGKDWETELRQCAREQQLMRQLGLVNLESTSNQETDKDVPQESA